MLVSPYYSVLHSVLRPKKEASRVLCLEGRKGKCDVDEHPDSQPSLNTQEQMPVFDIASPQHGHRHSPELYELPAALR